MGIFFSKTNFFLVLLAGGLCNTIFGQINPDSLKKKDTVTSLTGKNKPPSAIIQSQPATQHIKFFSKTDGNLFIDYEPKGNIRANQVVTTDLVKGTYLIKFISSENEAYELNDTLRVFETNGEKMYTIDLSKPANTNIENVFTDPRDSQKYPYKQIGDDIWMTMNLNYAAPGSWCYNGNNVNCGSYGRLYDWKTAGTVAPPGWHLPSETEWSELIESLGGDSIAGKKMKSVASWRISLNTGDNWSGFTGLPGGYRISNGSFTLLKESGFWWTSTSYSLQTAASFALNFELDKIIKHNEFHFKEMGLSVRCIKDKQLSASELKRKQVEKKELLTTPTLAPEQGIFTDPRDGQEYTYKKIGLKVWMTKNLNYETTDSWCNNNDPKNCQTYGRLYNWKAAMIAAPPGWHLPSNEEWASLAGFLGGYLKAGESMKSTRNEWFYPNNATNMSGFSGLPGGGRYSKKSYGPVGVNGFWWSSTEKDSKTAWNFGLHYLSVNVNDMSSDKGYGYSIRCVRD